MCDVFNVFKMGVGCKQTTCGRIEKDAPWLAASFRDQRNSNVERTVDSRLSFILQRKRERYSKLFFQP